MALLCNWSEGVLQQSDATMQLLLRFIFFQMPRDLSRDKACTFGLEKGMPASPERQWTSWETPGFSNYPNLFFVEIVFLTQDPGLFHA